MTEPPESDPSRLIESACGGDTQALEKLLAEHHARLLHAVAAKVPNDLRRVVSAEDILQETFIDAFRYIHSFKVTGPDAFYRWLATIARNRLLDAVKSHRAAKRGGGRVYGQSVGVDAATRLLDLIEIASPETNTPSRVAASREAVFAMQVAIAGISDDHRQVLMLRYVEGLDVAATAERMGKTSGAVKMLTQRALESLKLAMGRTSQFFSFGP